MNNFNFEKNKKYHKTALKSTTPTKLKCSICDNGFKNSYFNNLQASGCASRVEVDGEIHCHFESQFDGDVYKCYHIPNNIKEGVICDKCIQKLIDAKKIYLLSDNLFEIINHQ